MNLFYTVRDTARSRRWSDNVVVTSSVVRCCCCLCWTEKQSYVEPSHPTDADCCIHFRIHCAPWLQDKLLTSVHSTICINHFCESVSSQHFIKANNKIHAARHCWQETNSTRSDLLWAFSKNLIVSTTAVSLWFNSCFHKLQKEERSGLIGPYCTQKQTDKPQTLSSWESTGHARSSLNHDCVFVFMLTKCFWCLNLPRP